MSMLQHDERPKEKGHGVINGRLGQRDPSDYDTRGEDDDENENCDQDDREDEGRDQDDKDGEGKEDDDDDVEDDDEDVEDDDPEDDNDQDGDPEDDEEEIDDPDDAERGRPQMVSSVEHGNADSKIPTDADCYRDYFARLKKRRSSVRQLGLVGAATGLPHLDEATGGLQQLTILGGYTQTGKTSLAAQICLAALRHDLRLAVVYFILDDMSRDDLFDQILCHEARIDYQVFQSGKFSKEEEERLNAASARLHEEIRPRMRTFDGFAEKDGYGFFASSVVGMCRRFMRQVGAERVLLVIDMFDDLPLPTPADDYRESIKWAESIRADPAPWRLQELLEISRISQRITEGGWPILVLAKLRKSLSRHEEPSIDDLLGCVELGYKAMRVFFLVAEKTGNAGSPVVPMTLVVKKARHATSIRLPLNFHHTQFRFEEAKDRLMSADNKKRSKNSNKNPKPDSKNGQPERTIDPLAGMEE